MSKKNIFPQSILYDFLIDEKLHNEIIKELKTQETNKEKFIYSNVGGFHSSFIENEVILDKILKKSFELITDNYKIKTKTNFNLTNLWINKNKKYNHNISHTHPGSNFSGVYYLNVPKENGELVFLENDKRSLSDLEFFLNSEEFKTSFNIKPKENMFLIFPSYMSHMVSPHYEDLDRLSISFNIKLSSGQLGEAT